jgi:5-methylcytosine-specific restriction endonuclease McrA
MPRTARQAWTGRKVMALRARVAATLPQPCSRCGQPVWPEQDWHLDHTVPLAHGAAPFDPEALWPAHARCNTTAGATAAGTPASRRRMRHITAGHSLGFLSDGQPTCPPFLTDSGAAAPLVWTRSEPLYGEG